MKQWLVIEHGPEGLDVVVHDLLANAWTDLLVRALDLSSDYSYPPDESTNQDIVRQARTDEGYRMNPNNAIAKSPVWLFVREVQL